MSTTNDLGNSLKITKQFTTEPPAALSKMLVVADQQNPVANRDSKYGHKSHYGTQ